MEDGNRTWSASAFRFIPSPSRLHRDSCVVKAFLHGAFWPGFSSVISESSNMTSSSLPLYQKIFSKTYSELPVFHQNRFRTWKLLRTTGSPLIMERVGGNLAETLPRNAHPCMQGWTPAGRATCWFWWVPPRQESSWAVFSWPWRIPCCLSGSPTAFLSAAELEGCLTSCNLLSQASPPRLTFLGRAPLGVFHHLLGHLQGSVGVGRAALLGISFPVIFQPPNPVNYLIYCYSVTLGLFDFARVRLIPNHKWRRMWKIVTNNKCWGNSMKKGEHQAIQI